MSLFDKDLIQKDFSLEDQLHIMFVERVKMVTHIINEMSDEGITVFDRVSDKGTWGLEDNGSTWGDRYAAFLDYLYVSINKFQQHVNNNPIIQDGNLTTINNFWLTSNLYKLYSGTPFKVEIKCVVRSGNHTHTFTFNFDVQLDLPNYWSKCWHELQPSPSFQ